MVTTCCGARSSAAQRLFEDKSIAEVKVVEKHMGAEIETKRAELRELVGARYR